MWTAALTGFVSKLYFQHRLNNVSTVSYLALGWLPALVLGFYVPAAVGIGMLAGGIVYSIGVWFLIASDRFYFAHAIWHILVICAAGIHYGTILRYVAS
ncbi:MAG: hemolysin III, partial [Planctomycetota bacterium]